MSHRCGLGAGPVARLLLLVACVALALACTQVDGFSFSLKSGETRCFTEEVPSGIDMTIAYTSKSVSGLKLDVAVTSDDINQKLWENMGASTGSYRYRVMDGGDYTVCFQSRLVKGAPKGTVNQARTLEFIWNIGTENTDYKEMATKEKLKPLEIQMRAVEDSVRRVLTEYMYYKEREAEMRNTNEHMTAKVMWISFALLAIFGLFSYFQMRYLKRYFKKKRMID